jgi:predicted metal-dependent phosphoesterase TrpH
MNNIDQLIRDLNHESAKARLQALKDLMEEVKSGRLPVPQSAGDVNNHIHTTYSFSPYSPAKAVWMAYQSGLASAGIMDHDSIGGAREFIEAGRLTGVATTIGLECRADFSKTRLNGRIINNPDQISNGYMIIHGIPHTEIEDVKNFFAPLVDKRNIRNRAMVEKLNSIFKPYCISIDFDEHVVPLSNYHDGGSVTERHILFALVKKVVDKHGYGRPVVKFLRDKLKINPGEKISGFLLEQKNPHYLYDLLGVFKSSLVESFYVDATDECPDAREIISFTKSIGAIMTYGYLGDIGESVTGDKKPQKLEDEYLDLLFDEITRLGFQAVAYMPTRNTPEQISRIRTLCEKYNFLQISGEDINTSRQSFICNALRNGKFSNLVDATWALIGHEKAATEDMKKGIFSQEMVNRCPDLSQRIQVFKEIGMKSE